MKTYCPFCMEIEREREREAGKSGDSYRYAVTVHSPQSTSDVIHMMSSYDVIFSIFFDKGFGSNCLFVPVFGGKCELENVMAFLHKQL